MLAGHDAVVVGAGIVGLTAATAFKRMHPGASVAVVDADPFSGGGTTRNAGFACFGSASELEADRAQLGDERALQLVKRRVRGLAALRARWSDEALGYVDCGSHEVLGVAAGFPAWGAQAGEPVEAEALRGRLPELNRWVQPATGLVETFGWVGAKEAAGRYGVNPEVVEGLIASPGEGALQTDRLFHCLEQEARETGVKIWRGLQVDALESGDNGRSPRWRVRRVGIPAEEGITLEAGCILVANNGLARQLLAQSGAEVPDVQPVRNRVLVTHPIPGWQAPGTYHADRGYLYAREVEGRLLIGGGRHWELGAMDLEAELLRWAETVWPATRGAKIAFRWDGYLGIGGEREPIVTTWMPGIHIAVRLGGMGVAIGTDLGRELAALSAC
jgi:glycine/D-amino acid oxidase-like deaminating enzyme